MWIDISIQSLLDSVPDAMIVVNKAGRIIVANKQAQTMFGYTCEQFLEKPLEELIPPRLRVHCRHYRDTFFASPQTQARGSRLELFVQRKDGVEIPVDLSLSHLIVGGVGFAMAAIRDTTEQRRTRELKEAEAVLRGGVEGFRLIANIAPVPIWVAGLDKGCTYFNDRWLEFTGRSMEAELGNGWAEGVHPDDLKKCMDTYVTAFDRREQFRMEYRLRRHNGEYRSVIDVGVPRFDQDGSFAGYIGVAVDTTERRQAEEALQKSEERFRLAAQAGRMLAYEWDPATQGFVASGAVDEILGPDVGASATFEHILAMIPAEDRESVMAGAAQLTPEKPFLQIRHRMTRSDGILIWVERRSQAHFDKHGKMLLVIGMLTDITDRVKAEEALRESQRQLLLVYNNVADSTFDVAVESDGRYRFVSVNPAFLKTTGLTEDQVVGKLVRGVIPEPSLTMVLGKYQEAIRNKKAVRWEETSQYPTGRLVGEVAVAPVFDETGRCIHLIGAVHDITERKRAEEALAEISRKLLGAQEQERARIARELHDDTSQQLALLSVDIQRMKEGLPVSAGELRSQMDELEKQTWKIATDVQSLSHELHSSKLEYLGIVSAIRSFCKEFGDKHQVKVDFGDQGIAPTVPQNISLCLFRIVQEGLHNAVKHSGVRFFEVKLEGSTAEIHLTVSDSGRGFDPELAMEAQGLGLVSMKERVRLVNGTLSITSKAGSGTEISVRVPLAVETSGT